MKTLEIVTHAYAEKLPDYAGDLIYHLSSLVLFPPTVGRVRMTVCYSPSDERVCRVLEWFTMNTQLNLNHIWQEVPELGRRTIGRNIAAKQTKADIVWFADGDFAFRQGCLDALFNLVWPDATMVFPRTVKISKDHEGGDAEVQRLGDRVGLVDINPLEYEDTYYRIAIGGIQIVPGDFAREWGYLGVGKEKWLQPARRPFHDTLEDKIYRGYCLEHGKGVKSIELPELYRIRQTKNARQ